MVVRVYSGLMSRIRMIYDAYIVVKKYEKVPKLTILWESESGCNIHYDDVFASEQFSDIELKVVEVDEGGYWEWKSIHKSVLEGKFVTAISEINHRIHLKKTYRFYSKGCEVVRYNDCPNIIVEPGDFSIYNQWKENKWKQIKRICEEHKNIYIDCYESFIVPRDASNISGVIKFKPEYVEAADRIVGEEMIGIHIRRTDHELAKKLSPVELFIQKIDSEIKENNAIKFFLSTDDKDVETELIKKYGSERLIVQSNKIWGRLSKNEMISGILDCLCLSKCKKIYGSLSSQFSGFAAEYGKIPIEIIKK